MPRGGKREKAGRKTSWQSGVRFEDTSPLRIPNYLKDQVLELAHKLDSGETLELVSNSNQHKLDDLEQQVFLLLSEKERFLEQIEKSNSELETKSENFQLILDELQQKNYLLQEDLSNDLVIINDQVDNLWQLAIQFLHEWLNQIRYPGFLQTKINSYELLGLEEKIDISEIVTESNLPKNETVTESEFIKNEIVTESDKHIQMDLLDMKAIEIDEKDMSLKPLTSVELSIRFGKSKGFVKALKFSYKNRMEELPARLKQDDPKGVAWKFSDDDQKYHPILQLEISID